jgi:hypothetical protein
MPIELSRSKVNRTFSPVFLELGSTMILSYKNLVISAVIETQNF